jgi:hypothetical protein
MPGATTEPGIVKGQRAVRELLGVRMATVRALVEYDAARGGTVFARSASRGVVKARADEIWRLYREWEAGRRAEAEQQ